MCRRADIGTPANASWRATPLPQSMTYDVSFAMTTCAGAELALRRRGPPPVPRRISLVPTLYASSERRNVVTISAERSGSAAAGGRRLDSEVRRVALPFRPASERTDTDEGYEAFKPVGRWLRGPPRYPERASYGLCPIRLPKGRPFQQGRCEFRRR